MQKLTYVNYPKLIPGSDAWARREVDGSFAHALFEQMQSWYTW